MTISLNKNLKKLRINAEMTQEQLAERLGVSPQTVSRWENDGSYPDITMLPVLASLFDISVDALLGVDPARKEQQISEALKRSHELFSEGKSEERVAYLREKVNEFPDSFELLYQYGGALNSCNTMETDLEAIEVLKKAEKYASSYNDTTYCRVLAADIYKRRGEDEKAMECIKDRLHTIYESSEVVLQRIVPWQTAQQLRQNNLLTFADLLFIEFNNMSTWIGTPEQNIEMLRKGIQIYNIVLGDNADFYHERISNAYMRMSRLYCELQDKGNAYDCLKKAVRHAELYEKRSERYDAYWLQKAIPERREDVVKDTENDQYQELLEQAAAQEFNFIREESEFIGIMDSLITYSS